jgi:hypothetical protein
VDARTFLITMVDILYDSSVSPALGKRLSEWLATPQNDDTQQLERWCSGYDLGAIGQEEEPYQWILGALPEGPSREERERGLSKRVADLLLKIPNPSVARRSQKVLYNLLKLSAGLSCGEELLPSLENLLKSRTVTGDWDGANLRAQLFTAVAANQVDERFDLLWKTILNRGENNVSPYIGFEGALLMPPSASKRGEPNLDAIGNGLLCMAKQLDPQHQRRVTFRRLIDEVLEIYPGRQSWPIELLFLADRNLWPEWAVECLPSLLIWDCQEPGTAFVWHYLLAFLPTQYGRSVKQRLCEGAVLQVSLDERASEFLQRIGAIVEANRLDETDPSLRATQAGVVEAIIQGEKNARTVEEATFLQRAREQLMLDNNMLPDVTAVIDSIKRITATLEEDLGKNVKIGIVELYPDLQRELRHNSNQLPDWAKHAIMTQSVHHSDPKRK